MMKISFWLNLICLVLVPAALLSCGKSEKTANRELSEKEITIPLPNLPEGCQPVVTVSILADIFISSSPMIEFKHTG